MLFSSFCPNLEYHFNPKKILVSLTYNFLSNNSIPTNIAKQNLLESNKTITANSQIVTD